MARTSRRMRALGLLLFLAPLAANAQLSSVPALSKATESTSANTDKTTGQTTAKNTQESKTTQNTKAADSTTASTSGNIHNAATASLTQSAFHLTGLPTIAGAGIPTLVIPYTASAPYMQKSRLPEGTFFIIIGAILAFFGAGILLWRGLVAWSVNRSVKRTAATSVQFNEKPRTASYWGGSGKDGYNRVSTSGTGKIYKDNAHQSVVSLDNLTTTGKHAKPHFRDSVAERNTSANGPPTNLFFSPTAQATQQRDSYRNSSGYMPSGFYASPSSQPAGGHNSTTIGGLAPGHTNTQRYSAALSSTHSAPSPPASPSLPPQSRGSGAYRNSNSRDGLRAPSRDGLRSARNSAYLYDQPSSSSLMVGGASSSDLAGSRAPSAVLEDMFENHGNGPRERF